MIVFETTLSLLRKIRFNCRF